MNVQLGNRRFKKRTEILLLFISAMALASTAKANLEKQFEWETYGIKQSLSLKIPAPLLMHYASKTRTFKYGNYIEEDAGYELNERLAQAFRDRAKAENFDEWHTINMVVDFVQSLEYQSETGEYPKYPVETLMDGGGDCEDTSILLAAILDKLGIDCVLLSPPGHMAVGVAVEGLQVKHYPFNGHHYFYVETTGSNWSIGAIPPDHAGAAKVFALPSNPLQRHHLQASPAEAIESANVGTITNVMVSFYRAATGNEEVGTHKALYRYLVHVEADKEILQKIVEVQYRFLNDQAEVDPRNPWMRADNATNDFAQEWIGTDYRPMQVRIFFVDGDLVQTVVKF